MAQFDESLFDRLKPPLLPLKVVRFDGSRTGDEVHLRFGFSWLGADWVSLITEDGRLDDGLFFVDEGKTLPAPMKSWRHRHLVLAAEQGSLVVDDVEFSSGSVILDALIYPGLYLQFLYRKPVYKRVFRKED